jgi:hypothetical protein
MQPTSSNVSFFFVAGQPLSDRFESLSGAGSETAGSGTDVDNRLFNFFAADQLKSFAPHFSAVFAVVAYRAVYAAFDQIGQGLSAV